MALADQRLYEHKNRDAPSTRRQSADVLRRALVARHGEYDEEPAQGVAELALQVAEELGLDEAEALQARLTAELRDVGMVAIPETIVANAGHLSDEDQRFLEQHAIIGERIVAVTPALGDIAVLVRSTHENFDGSGYPDGLTGDAIPLASRIVAVCEEFYMLVGGPGDAVEILRLDAGARFDPSVVEALALCTTRIASRSGSL
ncbi:MAG: HD-GYP domain-containing protein [Solirubrobacterales bacterium]